MYKQTTYQRFPYDGSLSAPLKPAAEGGYS